MPIDLSGLPQRQQRQAPQTGNKYDRVVLEDNQEAAQANMLDDIASREMQRMMRTARRMGVPLPAVRARPSFFEHQERQEDTREAITNDPFLSRYLSNPVNAAAARDDVSRLGRISSLVGNVKTNNLGETALSSPWLLGGLGVPRPLRDYGSMAINPQGTITRARAATQAEAANIEAERPSVTPGNPLPILKGWGLGAIAHIAKAGAGANQRIFDMLGMGDGQMTETIGSFTRSVDRMEASSTPRLNTVGMDIYGAGQSLVDMLLLRGLGTHSHGGKVRIHQRFRKNCDQRAF